MGDSSSPHTPPRPSPPTHLQVQAGPATTYSAATVVACGNISVAAGYSDSTITIANPASGSAGSCYQASFAPNTDYDIYLVGQDAGNGGLPVAALDPTVAAKNLQASVTRLANIKCAPARPPARRAQGVAREHLRRFRAAVPLIHSRKPPSPAHKPCTRTSHMHTNPKPRRCSVVSAVSVHTADVAPPVSSAGFPRVANVKATGFDLQAQLNKAGKMYYAAFAESWAGATPTTAQIRAGQDYYGAAPFNFGFCCDSV